MDIASSSIEAGSPGFVRLLRRYPLISYFLIALAVSWPVVVIVLLSGAPASEANNR